MEASFRPLTLLALPLLGIVGCYMLFGLGWAGGLFQTITDVVNDPAPLFPGSKTPLLLRYTGIGAIDALLKNLVPFFAPLVDYRSVPLTMFWIAMIGQFGAGFALFFLEAARLGNRWRAASFVAVYGFLVQIGGWASMTPFFLFLHTLTSPLAKSFSAANPTSNVLVSQADLAALPISLTFGYLIPTGLLMLSPSLLSPVMQQAVAAIWQPFPIYVALLQFTLKSILGGQQKPTIASYLPSVRRYYSLALVLCASTHIPIVLLSLLSPSIFESWSPTLAAAAGVSFPEVFIPPLPLLSWRMRDYAEGVHVFVQWDTYISALASTLWATMLLRNVSSESNAELFPRVLTRAVTWFFLAGPFGPVIDLLRQRDEIACKKMKQ